MLAIRNLQSCSLPEITAAFNDGFSDYFIDVELNPELMAYKIAAEDIDLTISVGAFEEEHLVGLILHGNRQLGTQKIAYNAGTCVRPAFRRRGLVRAMYAHILPELQRQGFSESILEVIDINTPAYLAYEGIGFVRAPLKTRQSRPDEAENRSLLEANEDFQLRRTKNHGFLEVP
jgi:ribosomal protein S18 acetylase RimI-like enzyme